jgi:hypothetical protein
MRDIECKPSSLRMMMWIFLLIRPQRAEKERKRKKENSRKRESEKKEKVVWSVWNIKK